MKNNYLRIKAARSALAAFKKTTKDAPDTMESDIVDLVTDLLHLANRHGIDPAAVVTCALDHFTNEHGAREIAARKHGRSVKHSVKLEVIR
jgi:hypothetical protein